MKYTIEKIKGGECIFAPMEEGNSITIEIMCKAGSVYENKQNNGISHFLEHVFFKGGKEYPTPKAVAEAVDRFGGECNAYTGDEYAGYYIKCAPEFAGEAIKILKDIMIHPSFPKEELEREKGVVIQEVKMYEDNPIATVMHKRQERYFGDNSYGRPILGNIENIQSFTQEMLFQHKKELYTKDNLIIVVAGKILEKELLQEHIGEIFSALPEKRAIEIPKYPENHLPTKHESFFDKKTEQNHLIITAPGYTGNDERRYQANVLATILGGNMSSRLFQNIREKEGLCYYIRASNSSSVNHGEFIIRAGIDKERFDFGIKKIYEELAAIAKGNITQEEINNAIGYNEGQIQMGIEGSDEMASFLGAQYLLYGSIETLDTILGKYKAVTKEEVSNIAKDILSAEKLYRYHIQ